MKRIQGCQIEIFRCEERSLLSDKIRVETAIYTPIYIVNDVVDELL
ncbi:hypothetical protein [Carboxylicivirga sp. N1Y90]|nr:hypothetical protein [Marinilabiliaceae bacterium N1Y90]